MLYKIDNPVLVFGDNSINASGMIVRSADSGLTWENVVPFSTSIAKTTNATVIANAMAAVALQLATYDSTVTQVKAAVATLLDSAPYTVSL